MGKKGTYQKGTEEDEGDKIKVGKVAPALTGVGMWVTGPAAQTRQHDLMPGLPSGTPEKDRAVSTQRQAPRELCEEPRAWPAEPLRELWSEASSSGFLQILDYRGFLGLKSRA